MEHLSGRRKLSAQEADELIALYQRAATHLSVIRSRSPDPALVARLSRMVFAARSAITGGSRFSWRNVGRFFTVTFPLEVYRTGRWWVTIGLAFWALSMGLAVYVAGHPEVALAFKTEEEIDQLVNSDFAGYYSEYQAQNFALLVWANNAWVSALCLASGILIVPVIYLLSATALNLGILGGIMIGHGRWDVFFGMVLLSGLLEAFVTPSGLPPLLTVTLGAMCWVAFLMYVFVLGSKAAAEGESTDLDPALGEATVPTA